MNDEAVGALAGLPVIALVVAMHFWGRYVASRRPTRFWKVAAWVPVLLLIVPAVGVALTAMGLTHAFEAVTHDADPAHRAERLAQGISEAMNATAFALALTLASYLVLVVLFLVATLRKPPAA